MKNRFLPLIVSACLIISLCIVPGSAAYLSGTTNVYLAYRTSSNGTDSNSGTSIQTPRSNSSESISFGSSSTKCARLNKIDLLPSNYLGGTGTVGVYLSYHFRSAVTTQTMSYVDTQGVAYDESQYVSNLRDTWSVSYYNSSDTKVPVSGVPTLTTYVPETAGLNSIGVSLKWNISVADVMNGLYLEPLSSLSVSFSSGRIYLVIPSFTIIEASSNSDLSALEGIADQIAAGNALAEAMYGDIMAALNAIKGDTSDIAAYISEALTALNSIKTSTSGIYSLCSSYLHYLAQIASTSDSIDAELKAYHQDFMEMMETLNGTIIDESGNIQDKMEEIYNLLIAYLDTQFSSAINPDLQESTGNAQLDIEIQEGLEQGFQSDLTSSWTDLKLETFALGGGYTSAIAWVSSWFSNFYNALGDYGMIVMLPLYIGIVTLIAGLARQAIRRSNNRSSKSGGGEKGA